jgi:hypothetical protein
MIHLSQENYTKQNAVIFLLLSDGIMCGLTGVSWIIQKLVFNDYLNWDRSGWIIQNVSSSFGSFQDKSN